MLFTCIRSTYTHSECIIYEEIILQVFSFANLNIGGTLKQHDNPLSLHSTLYAKQKHPEHK